MFLSDGRTVSLSRLPVEAFAETVPQFQQSYWVPSTGLPLEGRWASYARMYVEQIWVYAVVRKISTLIARLGTNVWDMADAGTDSSATAGRTLDDSSPYARLMAKPCPYLDNFAFWLWVSCTKEIYGEAFCIKLRPDPDSKPIGLLPMHPAQTQIERDDEGLKKYRFMGMPNQLIPERDVVVYADYHPDNAMRGLSPLEPLRNTLLVEDSSRRAVNSWLTNAGRPAMVFQTDKRLGKEGRKRLETAFAQAHKGSDKAGGTLVLEDAVKAIQMQMNAKDLEVLGLRQLSQTEVCGAYDVPPSAVHILKDATYTNVTEQLRSIYRDSASWRIESLEQATDYYVGSEFNGDKRLKFGIDAVMRGDLELAAPAAATLVNSGIAMPDEVRPWFGFGKGGPAARKLWVNGTLKPMEQAAEPPKPPPALGPGAAPGLPGQAHQPSNVHELPKPPTALPAGSTNPAQAPGQGNGARLRRASLSEQAQQYTRLIGGAIGSGKSLQQVVRGLWADNPHDVEAIAEATAHIIERKQSA